MFFLTCDIIIETQAAQKLLFENIVDVQVATSVNNLTDTCKITLPRRYRWNNENRKDITKIIKRNDKITVRLGYDGRLETVFTGYLINVSTGSPNITVNCENEAWQLKQTRITAEHFPKFRLKSFVSKYMSGYQVETADAELGEVRINGDATLARVFDYLRQNYPLRFFFRDGVFYGLMNGALMLRDDAITTHRLKFGENIISDTLKYTLAEDVKVQIVAKAILKDNTKLEWKEPADGAECEVRTFLVPGATTNGELQEYAKNTLAEYKVDKMEGDITLFGEPYVKKGDIVHLFDDDNEERDNKRFIIMAVKYHFGKSGYRQTVMLGAQIR
jgi:hypothetical protein